MNQQTLNGTKPLPPFKTQAERLMYLQAQTLTAARNQFTGQNPSAPAGVPTIPDLTPIHLKVVNTTIVNPDGSYQMEVLFTQPTVNRTLIGSYKLYVENTTLNTSVVSIITWDKIVDVSYPNVVFIYSNPILQPGNSFMFRVSAVSTNGIESTSTPFMLMVVANVSDGFGSSSSITFKYNPPPNPLVFIIDSNFQNVAYYTVIFENSSSKVLSTLNPAYANTGYTPSDGCHQIIVFARDSNDSVLYSANLNI
jgi:hypothetical protein